MAKKVLNETVNYQMTPPPKERTYDNNYDISQYIDSDDEEQQAAHEQAADGKKIPKWAQGKELLNRIHAQFSKSPEEIAAIVKRIFPGPKLPVPLEEMGLRVRSKYATRSSSVNWADSAKIQQAVSYLK